MSPAVHEEPTPSVSFPKQVNRPYYPALDGLRAVSFFAVFLWHYVGIPYGWAGVDVFFVLSGFLITGILYDTREDTHRVRNFYIRRTLRIFPLYYAVLLGLLLLTPIFRWAWTWQWIAWPLYLGNVLRFLYPHVNDAYVSSFSDAILHTRRFPHTSLYLGHFWTLCVEEQFYLVWPWIVFRIRDRRKLMYICMACIVLIPIARWYAEHHLPAALVSGEVVLHSTPFRFDTLMMGALIALLYRGSHKEQLQKVARYIVPIGAAYLLYALVRWKMPGGFIYPRGYASVGLAGVSLFAAALMVRTLVPGSIPYRVLNFKPLRAVGVVSYGAYVFHDIPHNILVGRVTKLGFPHIQSTTAVLGVMLTLILAFTSYRFFELPILRLKDRFTSAA